MKRNRFTEEQIIWILKKHEAGVTVSELCCKNGVSDASIYKWKAKFGGMDAFEVKRWRNVDDEYAKLKPMLTNTILDNVALKEQLEKRVSPAAKRQVVCTHTWRLQS